MRPRDISRDMDWGMDWGMGWGMIRDLVRDGLFEGRLDRHSYQPHLEIRSGGAITPGTAFPASAILPKPF